MWYDNNGDEKMDKEKMSFKNIKKDILLIGGFVIIGAVIFLFAVLSGDGGKTAEIRVDGKVTAAYSLSENRTVEIQGAGGVNLLVIENGEVYMKDADCPDSLCVKQGKISMKGQSIICLPHKVVVEITGDETKSENSDIDIIVK